jgi:hypothetical protein
LIVSFPPSFSTEIVFLAMNVCWPKCCCWVFRFLVLQLLVYLITAQPYVDPVMLVGNSWKTKTVGADTFRDGSVVRAILAIANSDPKFACGFFCNGTCSNSYFFVISIANGYGSPVVVWSAN